MRPRRYTLVPILIVIVLAFIISMVTSSSHSSYAKLARKACAGHSGVRQINTDQNVAVCMDGWVGSINY